MSVGARLRLLCALAAALAAPSAHGQLVPLDCERLFIIARSAIEHRDRGFSLDQVLAGLRVPEIEQRLTPEDLDVVRQAVTAAFLGHASPEDVALACVQARRPR